MNCMCSRLPAESRFCVCHTLTHFRETEGLSEGGGPGPRATEQEDTEPACGLPSQGWLPGRTSQRPWAVAESLARPGSQGPRRPREEHTRLRARGPGYGARGEGQGSRLWRCPLGAPHRLSGSTPVPHTHHQGVTAWAHTNLKGQKQLAQGLGEAEREDGTRGTAVPRPETRRGPVAARLT